MKTLILNPMPVNVQGDTLPDKFRRVGGNPGNLVFYEATKEQIKYTRIIDVRESAVNDASIIVPSSNFIRHVKNDPFFQRFIDFMDKSTCPITFSGLGAQGTPVFNTPKKLIKVLNSVQIRFFKMISERAVSLGVRGEFTAECLELMGIYNYKIIGCPSLFKYLDGVCPDIPRPKKGNVQMTVTSGSRMKSKVLKFGIQNQCFWVKQSYSEYPQFILNDRFLSPKWLIRNFPGDTTVRKELTKYHDIYSRVFFDIDSWNQFFVKENIKFSFGTRFHGNMEALRNGVPALWIVHDSRTRELTDFLKLPCIDEKDITKIGSMDELMELCDYTEMRNHYEKLCKNYVEYLNENEIEHKFCVKNM